MYCTGCGKELTADQNYCPRCGDKNLGFKGKPVKELSAQEIKPVAETMKVMARSYPLGLHYFFDPLRKYAVFSGRATRKEYWMFLLYIIIIGFVLGFIEAFLGINPESEESLLANILSLAIFIPNIAVSVRRMHDVDRSGWYLLLPIVNLILLCCDGTKGDNKYGPDPKEAKDN